MLYILFLESYILKRVHGLTCLIFTQPKHDPFIKRVRRVDLFLTQTCLSSTQTCLTSCRVRVVYRVVSRIATPTFDKHSLLVLAMLQKKFYNADYSPSRRYRATNLADLCNWVKQIGQPCSMTINGGQWWSNLPETYKSCRKYPKLTVNLF